MLYIFNTVYIFLEGGPAGWSSGNAFVYGAVGVRFKSPGIKSGTVLITTRQRNDILSKKAVLPWQNNA